MERFERITMDPEVMGGKPCIRGMRVTVGMIVEALPEICEYARQNKLVLLTNDLDFPQIPAHTRQSSPSVVI
jgi:hypothetical protein